MAAPSKLDDALVANLDGIADDGLTIKEVCKAIGIEPRTFRNWEARGATGEEPYDSFLPLAARVRAGMGSATDDMAWGVLREVAEDPQARASDRLAAATAILRLRTAHRVELTGKDGAPLTLAALAQRAADDER